MPRMETTTDTPQLYPLGAMARRLHVTTTWLRAEADAGHIPHLRAGDRLLFVPHVVIGILAERATHIEPHTHSQPQVLAV
jgi:hypothetical protein